ncbi:MFS transporter [Marivita sp. S0852]|uniref:MFS transporter n=1 Tax=Marivita sp. S0852 TaxID=3373893 RepID=UPI003982B1B2
MSMIQDLVESRKAAASFASIGVLWGTFAALVPAIKQQVGLDDAVFGLCLTLGALGAVGAMWLAPMAERIFGTRILPVVTSTVAAASIPIAFVTEAVGLTLAFIAMSMSSGMLDVVANARISAIESRVRRSLMNLNHAIFSIAYGAAAFATGLAREAGLGPVEIFAACCAVNFWLTYMSSGTPRSKPGQEDETPLPPAALPWSLLVPVALILLVGFMAEQSTEGWSALHLERTLDAGAAGGALGPTLLGLTMAIGRLSGQIFANRVSELLVIRWACLLSGGGAIIAALAPNIVLAYLGFALLGLGISVVVPMAMGWMGRHVTDDQRSVAIARVSVLGYAAFFIGPIMMGSLGQIFGLRVAFGAIALSLLLVAVVLVPILSHRARVQIS